MRKILFTGAIILLTINLFAQDVIENLILDNTNRRYVEYLPPEIEWEAPIQNIFNNNSLPAEYVNRITPVNMEITGNDINIYPNPAESYINISLNFPATYSRLEVYNILGKKVLDRDLTSTKTTIDVNSLPAGMYIFRIENANRFFDKKVIVGK